MRSCMYIYMYIYTYIYKGAEKFSTQRKREYCRVRLFKVVPLWNKTDENKSIRVHGG